MALAVVYSNAFGGVFAENRGGTVSTYVPDTLGSTIGLVSSSESLTDRWVYWPYGEVESRIGTNATPLTWLGILGYFQDVLNKFIYVRARHLRADLARWLTIDHLWPNQPAYSYVLAAPTGFADPSGTQPISGSGQLAKGCTGAYFANVTTQTIFGMVVSTTVNFSICICCTNDSWAAAGALIAGLIAFLVLLGPLDGAIAGVIAATLPFIWAWCYFHEPEGPVCIGWSGIFIFNNTGIGPPFLAFGDATCCGPSFSTGHLP